MGRRYGPCTMHVSIYTSYAAFECIIEQITEENTTKYVCEYRRLHTEENRAYSPNIGQFTLFINEQGQLYSRKHKLAPPEEQAFTELKQFFIGHILTNI